MTIRLKGNSVECLFALNKQSWERHNVYILSLDATHLGDQTFLKTKKIIDILDSYDFHSSTSYYKLKFEGEWFRAGHNQTKIFNKHFLLLTEEERDLQEKYFEYYVH